MLSISHGNNNNKHRLKLILITLLALLYIIIFFFLSFIKLDQKPVLNNLSYTTSWLPIIKPLNNNERLLNQLNSNWKKWPGGFNFQLKLDEERKGRIDERGERGDREERSARERSEERSARDRDYSEMSSKGRGSGLNLVDKDGKKLDVHGKRLGVDGKSWSGSETDFGSGADSGSDIDSSADSGSDIDSTADSGSDINFSGADSGADSGDSTGDSSGAYLHKHHQEIGKREIKEVANKGGEDLGQNLDFADLGKNSDSPDLLGEDLEKSKNLINNGDKNDLIDDLHDNFDSINGIINDPFLLTNPKHDSNTNIFKPDILSPLKNYYTPIGNLRQRLYEQNTYNSSLPIPKSIYQTWKFNEKDKIPKKVFNRMQSWILNNPDYNHTLFSDKDMDECVANEFKHVPEIVSAYNLLPKPVLKADFFRYLIIFRKGGVYADIDTINLKPINNWIASNKLVYNEFSNPGLVVGLESSIERLSWLKNFSRRLQFVQWTLQGKPGHPILLELIAHITEITLSRAKNNQLLTVLGKSASHDVMNWTGPGIWSDEILKYLNKLFHNKEIYTNDDEYFEYFTQHSLGAFTQPVIIHDVAMLPLTSFCPGANGGGKVSDPLAYVRHCFDGSWKNHKLIG